METYLRQTLPAMAGQFPEVPLVLFTNEENHVTLTNDLAPFKQVTLAQIHLRATQRPARIISEQLELPSRAKSAGVDVLWSPGYTAPYFSPCPQVVTVPDMQYKTHPQDLTPAARLATDILVRMAVRRCRRIIALSEFSRSEILRHTTARPDRMSVVPLAADPAFAAPLHPDRRRELLSRFLPLNRPYLLSVSASYPHKNLPVLLQAFGEIASSVPHSLVMVGNAGLGENAVRAAMERLPARERVIRLRGLSRECLVALYQGCDAFVFPSLYEGFGLPVLEAMMAGVPVVTTRCGAIPEIGGDAVFYVDPAESAALARCILRVIRLPQEERVSRICYARELTGKFSWEATARRTVDVFRQALIGPA